MPSKPKSGLRRMHQEMNSEAASSSSPVRVAVPPKRARVEEEVQTNETMQDLDGTKDERERTRKELDKMPKTMLSTEEDRDMWKRLFEDCNKKQGEEIERLRRDYKERSERLALTTAVEKVIPARSISRGQSPMELLTPREMSQTTNQLNCSFTGVPDTAPRACFKRATWNPAVNLQQPPLGTSHLILGVLQNLRTFWITTVMGFGGATIAQLFWMVELMNPGRIPNVMILVGTNNTSRSADEEEALWESMMAYLLLSGRSSTDRLHCTNEHEDIDCNRERHNEGVIRWNNILRNLACRNAGRMILMDIEHELRAMDQARLTTDGIHFDSIERQAWLNKSLPRAIR